MTPADRALITAALTEAEAACAELRARLTKPRAVLGQWPQRLAAHADLIERLSKL